MSELHPKMEEFLGEWVRCSEDHPDDVKFNTEATLDALEAQRAIEADVLDRMAEKQDQERARCLRDDAPDAADKHASFAVWLEHNAARIRKGEG